MKCAKNSPVEQKSLTQYTLYNVHEARRSLYTIQGRSQPFFPFKATLYSVSRISIIFNVQVGTYGVTALSIAFQHFVIYKIESQYYIFENKTLIYSCDSPFGYERNYLQNLLLSPCLNA